MSYQRRLQLTPEGAQEISPKLSLLHKEGRFCFFNGGDPILTISENDHFGIRVALGVFSDMELARPTDLARALGYNPSTAFRNRKKIREGGVSALLNKESPGPRGPSKLKGEVMEEAQRLLDESYSFREVARSVGVTEGAIRKAIARGVLTKEVRKSVRSINGESDLKRPAERAHEDTQSAAGVAVKRHEERVMASMGKLEEAAPRFIPAEAVESAGVFLALPTILELGLLSVGEKVYGSLKRGFYGLGSVLLTLVFMALLRIKTVEQLRYHAA